MFELFLVSASVAMISLSLSMLYEVSRNRDSWKKSVCMDAETMERVLLRLDRESRLALALLRAWQSGKVKVVHGDGEVALDNDGCIVLVKNEGGETRVERLYCVGLGVQDTAYRR